MPTIYRRETGQRLDDILHETIDRLIEQGRLTISGNTEFVVNDPNIATPRRRVIGIRRNPLTGEPEDVLEDEPVVDANAAQQGRGLEGQISNGTTITMNDIRELMDTLSMPTRPLSFTGSTTWTTTLSGYDDYLESQFIGKKIKEDRSKYSKTLNTIIDTVESFKKNLDKSLELKLTNGSFLLCIKPLNSKTTRVLIKHDNSKTFKVINFKDYNGQFKPLNSIETISALCFVKIKSCELSTKVFGYGNVKKTMMDSGENQVITSILPSFKCKKDDIERDIVEVSVNGRNIKFCIEDLEFILPDTDLLLKGYTPPKDRTINKGSEVRLVDNRKIGLPKDTKLVVNQINKVGTKRYCTAKYNNKEYTIAINKLKVT